MRCEEFSIEPPLPVTEFQDMWGNCVDRLLLPPGRTTIRHDMFIQTPSVPEDYGAIDAPVPVEELPAEVLRYTLPSRYCDSDKLMDFAFAQFGDIPHGLVRVQAICDWIHNNIEYRWGAGSSFSSVSDVIAQRFITGYVPDVAHNDRGTPMDFHAYFQVYVGNSWRTYDARFNCPRIGRVKIACGLDAVDGAFSTLSGAATLAWFKVWAYQVDPNEVRLGDPVDLSKRLDGTKTLRFARE